MKIAMMVRATIRLPRPHDMIYAPLDLMQALATGLAQRGHQVSVFAPAGSQLDEAMAHPGVRLETTDAPALVTTVNQFEQLLADQRQMAMGRLLLWDHYLASQMYQRAQAGHFDVLHFHHPESGLPFAGCYPQVPVLYTLHDPIDAWQRQLYTHYTQAGSNQHFVSISDNQRLGAPELNYLHTAYNGTDTSRFSYGNGDGGYLLFSGSVKPSKGVAQAITVARSAGKKLLIIGPIAQGEQTYFDEHVQPYLDQNIRYVGRVDHNELPQYYQGALALLNPIQWEEPFGLTTIEALACGTPVVSLRRGAAPEIIEHQRSGFIVETVEQMVQTLNALPTVSRLACRQRVLDQFSTERMVDRYEQAYMHALAQAVAGRAAPHTVSLPEQHVAR